MAALFFTLSLYSFLTGSDCGEEIRTKERERDSVSLYQTFALCITWLGWDTLLSLLLSLFISPPSPLCLYRPPPILHPLKVSLPPSSSSSSSWLPFEGLYRVQKFPDEMLTDANCSSEDAQQGS